MKIRNSIGESGKTVKEYVAENDEDRAQIHAMMLDGTIPSPPDTKNWVRLCAVIDCFRVRYGRWPTRIRIHPTSLQDIYDNIFTPQDFAKINTKIVLTGAGTGMVAEDNSGNSYDYSGEGSLSQSSEPSAAEWLGVQPRESIYPLQDEGSKL